MAEFENVPIDAVRDYWNRRPCNIRHSQKEKGTKEYFDEVEARKYFVEPHIPEFAEFPKWNGKKVLELGCGIGTDTINFARSGAQVTAVDLSEESLELARTRAKVFGLENQIKFYQANGEELSKTVPVEKFDLIYSFGVIHHTPHPDKALSELDKYAGPDSTLKLMVYNKHSWKVWWIIATEGKGKFWERDALVAKNSEAQTGCPVTYTYSKKEGTEWLQSHGYDVTEARVDHIFPYSIPEYKNYEYKKNWYFRAMPDAMFRTLEQAAGWHLLLTAKAPKDFKGKVVG